MGRRLAKILSFCMVAAACQGSEVLTVLPDDASLGVQPWSFPAPTNLVATARTTSRIDLTWQDETPNESGFEIMRSAPAVEFTLVSTTAANISSWSDSGLLAATRYCYMVRAVRTNGRTPTYSYYAQSSCANTLAPPAPPPPPPGEPSYVWAAPLDSATIKVDWYPSYGSLDEVGYRVERSSDGGATWTTAATVAPDILSWTGGDPLAEQSPCYRIVALFALGESGPSAVRCAVPPAAPSNLAITVLSSGEIELTWNDNSAVEEMYEVWTSNGSYCCPGDGCDSGWYENPIATLPANTTRYRIRLASSECQPISVFIMAYKLGNAVISEYVAVPPLP
jgi:hypothetical protein